MNVEAINAGDLDAVTLNIRETLTQATLRSGFFEARIFDFAACRIWYWIRDDVLEHVNRK